jgi:hypothetical protein
LALVAKAGTRYQNLPGFTDGLEKFAFKVSIDDTIMSSRGKKLEWDHPQADASDVYIRAPINAQRSASTEKSNS